MSGAASVRTDIASIGAVQSRWILRLRSLSALLSVLLASAAIAAEDSKIIFPGGATKSAAPSATSSSTLNSITLVVALLMAVFGAWLFLRNRRTPGTGRDMRLLTVDETRSLGNRQYLVVASYQDKKFLLGVCPGRIDMLAPLHEESRSEEKRT